MLFVGWCVLFGMIVLLCFVWCVLFVDRNVTLCVWLVLGYCFLFVELCLLFALLFDIC